MKEPKALKTAKAVCLAAGLVSTWDASPVQAADYTFTGQITPTHDLYSVYFLFAVGTCSPGGGVFMQKISDHLTANVTTPFDITFSSLADGLGTGDGFTVVGLYDPVNGGVSLGYDPGRAAGVLSASAAQTWDSPFLPDNGSDYVYVGASEADAASSIAAGQIPLRPVGIPFPNVSTDPSAPSAFTLIDYSAASNGGSGMVLEVVPEPGSLSFLAAGAAVLSCRWFRRKSVA